MSVYQSVMGRVSLLYPCGGCEDKHVIGDAQKWRAGEGCMIERLLCTSKRLSEIMRTHRQIMQPGSSI